jgi:arylsulfatase A-like enzyme
MKKAFFLSRRSILFWIGWLGSSLGTLQPIQGQEARAQESSAQESSAQEASTQEAPVQEALADRRPNILWLIADDLGYGELSCQGVTDVPTPGIDRLAKTGIRFTQAYVSASFCSPSRAGLLSGRYQTRFGHELNPVGDHNREPLAGMPAEVDTVAEALRNEGYRTGLVGKWHLGGTPELHPQEQGFESFFGFLNEGHYYVPKPYEGVLTFLRRKELPQGGQGRQRVGETIFSTHLPYDEPAYDFHNPLMRGTQEVEVDEYYTDAITREACDFIEGHAEEPFFLCVTYSAVHSPMQAPLETIDEYSQIKDVHRRVFAGMLHHLDRSVDTLLNRLEELNLAQDTLVVFLSDNGGPTRELTSSNAPLRSGKGSLYEGGIRVPMLVRWPSRWKGASEFKDPVIALDWMPTMLAAAEAPAPPVTDGVNLLPYLDGKGAGRPHSSLYWRMGNKTAFRNGDWKIIAQSRSGLVADQQARSLKWELYHLKDDLSENHDLASAEPERLRQLIEAWAVVNAEMVEPRWRPQRR